MATNSPARFTRDNGLRSRMYLTMLMLAGVYAFFILLLIAAGIPLIFVVGGAALLAGFQYFGSDRLILRSTGAKQVTRDKAPELYEMAEDLRKMSSASALAIYPALKGHAVQSLFSTHPPIEDRIARLRQMERDMRGMPNNVRFQN